MKTLRYSKNFIKTLILSLASIVIFFVFIETALRTFKYQPHIKFKDIQLPYWVSKTDSFFLDDYRNRLISIGKINQDIYAYQPNSLMGYVLKPNYKRKIEGYSWFSPVENMPGWTIISGEDGFRIGSHEASLKKDKLPGKSVFILGDSSSFGWGVDFKNTYGFVFTEIINRSLKPGDVLHHTINRSMPGLSTFNVLKAIRLMNDIKKDDWVLISLGSNDNTPALISDYQKSINFQSILEKLHRKSERFLFFKMIRSILVSNSIPFNNYSKSLVNRVSIYEYNMNLRSIIESINSYGGKPVLINICNLEEYSLMAHDLAIKTDTPFIDFVKQVKPLLSDIPKRFPQKFLQYFDAYGEKMEGNELYAILFPDGCHPNAIGHHLLGEVIFEALERKPGKIKES